MMRNTLVAFILLGCSTAAVAQSSFMTDVIGQAVSGGYRGADTKCLSAAGTPKPQDIAKAKAFADTLFASYVQQAIVRGDETLAFSHSKKYRDWTLDGSKQNPATDHDPWLSSGAHVELLGFVQGNAKIRSRALWRAVSADGRFLGTYDGLMQREDGGARFLSLELHSAGSEKQPKPLVMFCSFPGDVEAYLDAKAKSDAEKAAKQAAKTNNGHGVNP